jgi:V/A-type H+-transporting ATPase subunit I
MIVPMKKVSVIVLENRRNDSLRALRRLGLLHVGDVQARSQRCEDFLKELESLETGLAALHDAQSRSQDKPVVCQDSVLEPDEFAEIHAKVLFLIDQRKELSESLQKDKVARDRLAPWGDFRPADVITLRQAGIGLEFFRMAEKELARINDDVAYLRVATVGKQVVVAVVGGKDFSIAGAQKLELPAKSLSELDAALARQEQIMADTERELAALSLYLPHYKYQIGRIKQELRFEAVSASMDTSEQVAWITGFIPADQASAFQRAAHEHGWGYALDDPSDDDEVPTLVRNKRWIDTIAPVFSIMGTVPGYHEYDISMWFLMFFSLFFAMIVGDAAYGLIFLALAAVMHRKSKKLTNAVVLTYVLSGVTILWGALTGTWFGSKAILEAIPLLQALVIPQLSNYPELFGLDPQTAQNMVMKFCFIIGTLQLSLACSMNILRKIPKRNLSAVADFGWLIMIDALYFLVLMLVINQPIDARAVAVVVGLGFALVVLFGAQGPGVPFGTGLAKGAGAMFTTFLNSISAFSNIISYIRLFAVGMASLAIAQSFNNMAAGMLQGLALPAGLLILVVGHGLNLVMGVLSVVVHGVRLNLLEFSGQLGMEWTGVAYDPFRETTQASHTL